MIRLHIKLYGGDRSGGSVVISTLNLWGVWEDVF